MAIPGVMNELPLLRVSRQGGILDGGDLGEIPLPLNQVPEGARAGEPLRVFVYHDAGDRLAATTQVPLAQVGEVAYLKIVAVKDAGAFLNWGLPKDLLLSWREVKREQKALIVEGRKILVTLFHDEQSRVAASAKLDDFLADEAEGFHAGEKVKVIVADTTDLGIRVIVNHRYWGLVHRNEVFRMPHRGETRDGYVKALRPDRKLDIALTAPGYAKADAVGENILKVLIHRGGYLPVTDKSAPETIYGLFGVSKKAFKLALGALYKNRQVLIETEGIRLVKKGQSGSA